MLMKKKNIITVIVTVVFICLITYLIVQISLYYHPRMEISILYSDDSLDYSYPIPVIAILNESVLGMSEESKNDLRSFTKKMTQFQEMIIEKYEKPIKLDLNVRHENDKTIINYLGIACDKISKNIVDVNEEVVLDFIIDVKKITLIENF